MLETLNLVHGYIEPCKSHLTNNKIHQNGRGQVPIKKGLIFEFKPPSLSQILFTDIDLGLGMSHLTGDKMPPNGVWSGSGGHFLILNPSRVVDVPGRRSLHSVDTNRLVLPPVKLSTVGSRAFPVAASQTWNSLPEDVTSASTLRSFQQRLKTYLFRQCFSVCYSTFIGPRSDMSLRR